MNNNNTDIQLEFKRFSDWLEEPGYKGAFDGFVQPNPNLMLTKFQVDEMLEIERQLAANNEA